jgi:DNA (cytosine-5)-methyltransferase 1
MPQSRIRLFVVGFKEKSNFEFPQPIELKKKMSDFLEFVFINEQSISQKGKDYVLNEERMRKRITQVNGDIMLCQVRNQQSNFIGDFVSEKFTRLEYIRERERERAKPVFRAICSLG